MVAVERLLPEDDEVTVWWGTWAECAVAVSRLRREGRLDDTDEERARTVLAKDHPLRAADALQLATVLIWCGGVVAGKGFVCLDNRSRQAAYADGFDVLPSLEET